MVVTAKVSVNSSKVAGSVNTGNEKLLKSILAELKNANTLQQKDSKLGMSGFGSGALGLGKITAIVTAAATAVLATDEMVEAFGLKGMEGIGDENTSDFTQGGLEAGDAILGSADELVEGILKYLGIIETESETTADDSEKIATKTEEQKTVSEKIKGFFDDILGFKKREKAAAKAIAEAEERRAAALDDSFTSSSEDGPVRDALPSWFRDFGDPSKTFQPENPIVLQELLKQSSINRLSSSEISSYPTTYP